MKQKRHKAREGAEAELHDHLVAGRRAGITGDDRVTLEGAILRHLLADGDEDAQEHVDITDGSLKPCVVCGQPTRPSSDDSWYVRKGPDGKFLTYERTCRNCVS